MMRFKLILSIYSLLSFFCVSAQPSRYISARFTSGISTVKNVGNVVYVYPAFIDLKIYEPPRFAGSFEISLIKNKMRFYLKRSVGISRIEYYDRWEYDPATTGTNYKWGQRNFVWIHGGLSIGKNFKINSVQFTPEVGISYQHLIRAQYDSESKFGFHHQNLLSQLNRRNTGVDLSIPFLIRNFNSQLLSIGPHYRYMAKSLPMPNDKRFHLVGLAMELKIPR